MELTDNFELTSTKYIGVEGSVRIFLYMIWQPCSHRNSHERFYYSGETVHKNFNKVLRSIWKLGKIIIKPIYPINSSSQYVRDDNRYWSYIKKYTGAMTHILKYTSQ